MIPEIIVAQVLRACMLYVLATSEHTKRNERRRLQLQNIPEFLLFLRRIKYEVMGTLAHI